MTYLRRNAISLAALFIALTGTSYAVTTLGRNTVGTPQIRNHAVTAAKLSKAAQPLTATKLRDVITDVVTDPANSLTLTVKSQPGDKGDTGPQGPAGVNGAQGAQGIQGVKGDKGDTGDRGVPGGLTVYGRVAADGTVTSTLSSGLTVTHPQAGFYCLASAVPLHVALVTVEGSGATTRSAAVLVAPSGGEPCAGSDAQVATAVSGSSADAPFYVAVA